MRPVIFKLLLRCMVDFSTPVSIHSAPPKYSSATADAQTGDHF